MLREVVFAHMVEGSTCQRFVGIVKKFQYDLVYPKRCHYLATELTQFNSRMIQSLRVHG
jgi:hypothetical protein